MASITTGAPRAKKARKVKQPMIGQQTGAAKMNGPRTTGGYQGVGGYKVPGITPPKPAAPAANPNAAAAAGAPVPTQSITPIAPPATMEGLNTRTGAYGQYSGTMADVNRQLMQAALRYGGAPKVAQFGSQFDPNAVKDANNPFAGLQDTQSQVDIAGGDPLSAVSVIGSNYDKAIKAVQEGSNADNTFFSSRRLNDEGAQGKVRSDAMEQAKRDYQDAVATLTTMLTTARGTRDTGFRGALSGEITAAGLKDPEAQADKPPAAPLAAATGVGPMAGKAPTPTDQPQSATPKKKAKRKRMTTWGGRPMGIG